jgi:N-acetylneuraminate synthase
MNIAGRIIGPSRPPYLVAEISGNHCGVLANAIRLIKAAKRAGADAVKAQCYTADEMTLDLDRVHFICQSGPWQGRRLYELYQKAQTPPQWFKELFHVADQEGITLFSSVFSDAGLDLLENLGCPAYKIASFEIVDLPLVAAAHATGKPLIISTGLASEAEIKDANKASGGQAAFLHCVSEYPTPSTAARLSRINRLAATLDGNPIGLSDHSLGSDIPVAGTALGVTIIEKHLKLGTADHSPDESEDAAFSLTPEEFAGMCDKVRMIWHGLQDKDDEPGGRQYRRSLYAVADIKRGESFTEHNIRSIRPSYGLAPKLLPLLLGRRAKRDFKRGDPLS